MFLIDLLTGLPVLALVLVLLTLGLVLFSNVVAGNLMAALAGSLAVVGVFVLVLLVLITLGVLLSLLRSFFMRAAVLEDLGVMDALRSGWALFRGQWKNAGLVWLILVGLGLVSGVVFTVVLVLLIPAYLVLLVPAALAALLPGLLAYGFTSLFAAGPLLWLVTLVAALPSSSWCCFRRCCCSAAGTRCTPSAVWTLTYRALKTPAHRPRSNPRPDPAGWRAESQPSSPPREGGFFSAEIERTPAQAGLLDFCIKWEPPPAWAGQAQKRRWRPLEMGKLLLLICKRYQQ